MPTYSTPDSWPIPTYVEPGDGVDAEQTVGDLAAAMEGTLTGSDVRTWTPTWHALGAYQPSGVTWVGRYADRNGWRSFEITGVFGPTASGGSSQLYLTLPDVCTAGDHQFAKATLWVPAPTSRYFHGSAQIDGGYDRLWPIFPVGNQWMGMTRWMNTDETAIAGTGIPALPGSHNVLNGGLLHVSGTYRPA